MSNIPYITVYNKVQEGLKLKRVKCELYRISCSALCYTYNKGTILNKILPY